MSPKVTFKPYKRVTPNWLGTKITDPKVVIPGGILLNAAAFPREDQVVVTLAAGAVTAGSNKTLTAATALTGNIPAGTILDFGAGEFATLTTGATKGATSITGVTLAADLEGSESATYLGVGDRKIEGGAFLGRTLTERDAGTGYGIADPANDEQFALLLHDVDLSEEDVAAGIQPNAGNVIYENLLPGWSALSSQAKTKVRSLYHCVTATA
ncbi:MAG: hypothetical protein SFY66_19765 [Oculatellaceae cyanobacterium bins.114]|nr:hypothetical protein [Oculatellaceae cyanobacterium bins.114]